MIREKKEGEEEEERCTRKRQCNQGNNLEAAPIILKRGFAEVAVM